MATRILLGLMLLVFGFNKFFEFLPAPEDMSEVAGNYFVSFMVYKDHDTHCCGPVSHVALR